MLFFLGGGGFATCRHVCWFTFDSAFNSHGDSLDRSHPSDWLFYHPLHNLLLHTELMFTSASYPSGWIYSYWWLFIATISFFVSAARDRGLKLQQIKHKKVILASCHICRTAYIQYIHCLSRSVLCICLVLFSVHIYAQNNDGAFKHLKSCRLRRRDLFNQRIKSQMPQVLLKTWPLTHAKQCLEKKVTF